MSAVSPPPRRAPSALRETASLAERMGYFQALRVALACVALASAVFADEVVGASFADIALVTAAYLLISGVAEGLRRLGERGGLPVVALMLLVDGLYLAWIMYETGGVRSPLRFLTYLHLIAVTLLASYRTGLKIALWHSLLYFVVYYAQIAGYLDARDATGAASDEFDRLSVFNVMAFWLIALGTAAFSFLNERDLRRRKADLESLAGLASKLEEIEEPASIAQNLLNSLGEGFGFKRGVVLGGQNGELALMAYRGPGKPGVLKPGTDAAIKEAWEERAPLLVKKLDPDQNPTLAALLPFARNLVVVPMYAEGQPVAVLVLEHAHPLIERRVVTIVSQSAAHTALALRNAWLLKEVQTMAETDPLTGVANHRVFKETLAREVSRAQRNGEPVTLLMLDVDHFKKEHNDKHGHPEGDRVLRGVASVLSGASREFDTVARYGGDEFAVVLPICSAKESLAVGERLRQSVSGIEAATPVTASAGVATFPNHARDADDLIDAADEALRASKYAGKNRITRSRRRPRRPPPSHDDGGLPPGRPKGPGARAGEQRTARPPRPSPQAAPETNGHKPSPTSRPRLRTPRRLLL